MTKAEALPLAPPAQGEPYLLTPGPLTTSKATKEAMLRDWGSWDGDFNRVTAEVRQQLLSMAGVTDDSFACVRCKAAAVIRSRRPWPQPSPRTARPWY